MNSIASRFSDRVDGILGLLIVVNSSVSVAKHNLRGFKSKHAVAPDVKSLHALVNKFPNPTANAYEGAFHVLCAEYELAIKELIEKYIADAEDKCPQYDHLPRKMRDWYLHGCSYLTSNLDKNRFKHLNVELIMQSVASCVHSSKDNRYHFIVDAYSFNESHFWPGKIELILSQRLGIDKIWQKLSRDKVLQKLVGTKNEMTTEQVLRSRLETIILLRNNIVHRGRSFKTPSESEVREAGEFLKPLISQLAQILQAQLDAM